MSVVVRGLVGVVGVRIRRARLTPYRLPLVRELRTAHGRLKERRGWLLALETDSGVWGWGDACPFPGLPETGGVVSGFGMESWSLCGERLASLAASLLGESIDARDALFGGLLDGLLDACEAAAPDAPGARFAIDCALHELAARAESCSVAELLARGLGTRAQASLEVNALVSGARPEAMVAQARELQAAGFQTFKLKVGADSPETDLQRVTMLREALGSESRIRLDANGAWTPARASSMLRALAPLDIELIEQPVAAHAIDDLARLRRAGQIRVAADESLADPEGARAVIAMGAADLLVLKPGALGGLRPAASLARAATEAGLDFFVTSLLDSALGVVAATHLAAALPSAGLAHGLGTSSLFAMDLAPQPEIQAGRLSVPTGPGWGMEVDPDRLARVALAEAIEISP